MPAIGLRRLVLGRDHLAPAVGTSGLGERLELVGDEFLYQLGVIGIAVAAEQVVGDAAAGRGVLIRHEPEQPVGGRDLVAGEQPPCLVRGRGALQHRILHLMVVGQGEGLRIGDVDPVGGERCQCLGAERGEAQQPADLAGRIAVAVRDCRLVVAVRHEVCKGAEGVGGVHRHALDILGNRDRDRFLGGARLARDRLVLAPQALLHENAGGLPAALAGDHLVTAVVAGEDDEVLEDAVGAQAGDERREVGLHAPHVRFRRNELVKGNEDGHRS